MTAEKVGRIALFLTSDLASYMTGSQWSPAACC